MPDGRERRPDGIIVKQKLKEVFNI